MELKDFVKETLVQITIGVKEAQAELKDTNCIICPDSMVKDGNLRTGFNGELRPITKVKMSIAVEVQETDSNKAGIGIAKIIKAGVDSETTTTSTNVSTLEFDVPVALPTMKCE